MKKLLVIAIVLACASPAFAGTFVWPFTNTTPYTISPGSEGLAEIYTPEDQARLTLLADEYYHSTFADYLDPTAERHLLGIGPDVSLLLSESGGTYNWPGTYVSQVHDGGPGNIWQMLHAKASNRFFDNTTVETPATWPGLVALYHMNDDAWYDSIGGVSGTNAGAAYFTSAAKLGSHSARTPGIDSYVRLPTVGVLNGQSGMTIAFWLKIESHRNWGGIACERGSTTELNGFYQSDVPGELRFRVSTDSGVSVANLAELIDYHRWYFVVGTWDQTDGRARLYIDGQWRTDGPATALGTYDAFDALKLGVDDYTAGRYTVGSYDEICIFDRSLAPEEIVRLYYVGSALRFQIRSGTTPALSGDFVGPDGTTNTYYLGANESLQSTAGFNVSNRYVQYIAHFGSSASGSETPRTESVMLQGTRGIQFDSTLLDVQAKVSAVNVTNLPYQAGTPYVGLSKKLNGGYETNGTYISRIFDKTNSVTWTEIWWALGEQLSDSIPGLYGMFHLNGNWVDTATDPIGHTPSTQNDPDFSDMAKLGGQCAYFDDGASSSYVAGFGLSNIQSVAFWINDENPDDGIMRFSGGRNVFLTNHTITVSGFTNQLPAIYVNGRASSKKLVSGWNHVALVWRRETALTGLEIGRTTTDYMGGLMDELAVYDRELTESEIRVHYESSRPTVAGTVGIQVRAADTTNALATSAWSAVYYDPPQSFAEVGKRYFQYQATLEGDGNSTPAFGRVRITGDDSGFFTIWDDIADAGNLGDFVGDVTRRYSDEMRLLDLWQTLPGNLYGAGEANISGVWHLDEGAWGGANLVYDTSGKGRNGNALNGAFPHPAANVGTHCAYFDGIDDYISLAQVDEMTNRHFTVAAWFNSVTLNRSAILSTYGGPGTSYFSLELNSDGTTASVGRAAFIIDDGSGVPQTAVSFMSDLNDGEWHHIAGVREGDHLYLYIDGDQVGFVNMGSYGSVDAGTPSIGRRGTESELYLVGRVDEVAMWHRSLSRAQIGDLTGSGYQAKELGTFTSPVIDALRPAIWETLAWEPDGPYGLPLNSTDVGIAVLWGFDGDANDSVGANAGTGAGDASFTGSGKFGTCLVLDGSGDWVDVTDDPALATTPFTIEAWVYPAALDDRVIVDKGDGTNNGYRLAVDAAGRPYFLAGNEVCKNAIMALRADRWSHLVATYDGASDVKLYVDGELRAVSGAGTFGTSDDLRIGAQLGVSGGRDFAGMIDQVAIHSGVLSQEEVLDHYRAGACTLGFQVRSGDTLAILTNQAFFGPGGSPTEYFLESTGSDLLADVTPARHMQYKIYFGTEDHKLTPRLYGVRVDGSSYATNNPSFYVSSGTGSTFVGTITEFGHTMATNDDTSVSYQISGNGTNWYYYDTLSNAWVETTSMDGVTDVNSRSMVSNNITSFYRQLYEKTGGILYYRAFLHSTGSDQVAIDDVNIAFADGRVVVTSPNGGEVGDLAWLIGVTYDVTWDYAGSVPGTVTVDYTLNGGADWYNVGTAAGTAGTIPWTTPGTVADNCLIRVVSDMFPSTIWDITDSPFQLTNKYAVVQHNGGPPTWYIGETNIIIWSAAAGRGNVRLDLNYEGTNLETIVDFTGTTGGTSNIEWPWVVSISNENFVSEAARLRVATPGGGYADYSDATFLMAGAVVTAPGPGIKVKKDATYPLTWKSAGMGTNVVLEIQTTTNGAWQTINSAATNASGYNTYQWLVTNQPTETARLRVRSLSDPRAIGYSPTFIIAAIDVVRPIGHNDPLLTDQWLINTTQDVKWVSAGASDYVNIHYSTNSGVSWSPIALSVSNDNTAGVTNVYPWVGVAPYPSPNVRIRVQDLDDPTNLWSMSKYDFHIAGLRVLYPNGPYTQEWIKDTQDWITWEYNMVGDNVIIEISYDDGANWTNCTGVGGASWPLSDKQKQFIPTNPTVRAWIRLRAIPTPTTLFSNVVDLSDDAFSVAGLRVDEPQMGAIYTMGETNNVKFRGQMTHAPGEVADIWYSPDGGTTFGTNAIKLGEIFQDTVPYGERTYNWAVEPWREPSVNAVIKVRAGTYEELSAPFTLRGIRFSSPGAGVAWDEGSKPVNWTHAGMDGSGVCDLWLSTEGYNPAAFTNQINPFPITIGDLGMTWNIPATITPTTNAMIKLLVTGGADTGYEAFSMPFTLVGLDVTVPTNAEPWELGGTHDIKWVAAGAGSAMDIFYSSDGGATYDAVPIAQAITSGNGTNAYTWTIETSRAPSTNAMIKVVSDLAFEAESAPFEMQGIRVISPLPGEILITKETNFLDWIEVGDPGTYRVDFIKDDTVTITISPAEAPTFLDWYPASDTNFITTNARIKITGQFYTNVSEVFEVVGSNSISIISPAFGEFWPVGSTNIIRWRKAGGMSNDFSVFYSLSPYGSSSPVPGTVAYDATNYIYSIRWIAPDKLTQAVISVKHNTMLDVRDVSPEFNICGRFSVYTPNGGDLMYALRPTSVRWDTLGSVKYVDVYYSWTPPYAGNSWTKANTVPIPNDFNASLEWEPTIWTWTVPNPPVVPVSTVRFRVQEAAYTNKFNAGAPGPYDDSDKSFTVKYYRVYWEVRDSVTLTQLNSLAVIDSSGWAQSDLSCVDPSVIYHDYPWGQWDTEWYHEYFYDEVVMYWDSEAPGSPPVWTQSITMTRSYEEPDYHVMANFAYDPLSTNFTIHSWLERSGKILETPTSCTITIFDASGAQIDELVNPSPQANGVFWEVWDASSLSARDVYFARVRVRFSGYDYSSGLTYTLYVPASDALLAQVLANQVNLSNAVVRVDTNLLAFRDKSYVTADFTSNMVAGLSSNLSDDVAALTNIIPALTNADLTALTNLNKFAGTLASISTAVETVSAAMSVVEPAVLRFSVGILNRPTTVMSGSTNTIYYKTESGMDARLTVYSPGGSVLQNQLPMTEITASGGIFKRDVIFDAAWGLGEFDIECRDSTATNAQRDMVTMLVIDPSYYSDQTMLADITNRLAGMEADLDTLTNDVALLSSNVTELMVLTNVMDRFATLEYCMTNDILTNLYGINSDMLALRTEAASINLNVSNTYDQVTNTYAEVLRVYDAVTNLQLAVDLGPLQAAMSNLQVTSDGISVNVSNVYDISTNTRAEVLSVYDVATNTYQEVLNVYDAVTNLQLAVDLGPLQVAVSNLQGTSDGISVNVSNVYSAVTNLQLAVDLGPLQVAVSNLQATTDTVNLNVASVMSDVELLTNVIDWADVENIQFMVSNINTRVGNMDWTDIENIQATVSNIDATVATLNSLIVLTNLMQLTNLTEIAPDITEILTTVQNIENVVGDIRTQTDTINWGDITQISDDIYDLSQTTENLFSEIESDLSALYEISSTLEILNKLMAATSADAAAAAQNARTAKTQVQTLQGSVSTLRDAIGSGDEETAVMMLTQIKSGLTEVKQNVAGMGTINEAMAPILARMGELELDIEGLATRRQLDQLYQAMATEEGDIVTRGQSLADIKDRLIKMKATVDYIEELADQAAHPPRYIEWWEAE